MRKVTAGTGPPGNPQPTPAPTPSGPPPGPGRGEKLLNVRHAAERLDVSPKTVYRLVYAGLLEYRNVGLGKTKPRIRVVESSLDSYIAGGRAA